MILIPAITPPHDICELINAINIIIKDKNNAKHIFEDMVKNALEAEHYVTLSSGRRALYLGLKALGIGKDDEIILPAFTGDIVPLVVKEAGAIPIPADVNLDDYNMRIDSTLDLISNKTKAILTVHNFGYPSQLKALREVCDDNNLFLIEDAANAFGARYDGKPVGTFGDFGILSYAKDKSISMFGGGALIFSDKYSSLLSNIAHPEKSMSSISTGVDLLESAILSKPIIYGLIGTKIDGMRLSRQYKHYRQDLNDRRDVSSLAYAIGIQQLEGDVLNKRRKIALNYNDSLNKLNGVYPPIEKDYTSSAYTYYFVRVESEIIRNKAAKRMIQLGIEPIIPGQGYPISKTLYPKNFQGKIDNSKWLAKSLIGIPLNKRIHQDTLARIFN